MTVGRLNALPSLNILLFYFERGKNVLLAAGLLLGLSATGENDLGKERTQLPKSILGVHDNDGEIVIVQIPVNSTGRVFIATGLRNPWTPWSKSLDPSVIIAGEDSEGGRIHLVLNGGVVSEIKIRG